MMVVCFLFHFKAFLKYFLDETLSSNPSPPKRSNFSKVAKKDGEAVNA